MGGQRIVMAGRWEARRSYSALTGRALRAMLPQAREMTTRRL
jgi:hypothetical protein